MKNNTPLMIAAHSLMHLSSNHPSALTSAQLAHCIGTNAVVVRRVMAKLRNANLVTSSSGHGGGWQINQSKQPINLKTIYELLNGKTGVDVNNQQTTCTIQRSIQRQLTQVLLNTEHFFQEQLANIKLNMIEMHVEHTSSNHCKHTG